MTSRWIIVPWTLSPTVWVGTADGLVLLDLIAVELAVNGRRRGWTLTREEAQFAARLLLDRGVLYSVISVRVGASADTLRAWFPDKIEPPSAARPRSRKPKPKRRSPARCGTRQGHSRHLRRREPPCEACRMAKNAGDRWYRKHGTYVGAPTFEPAAAPA
ncbi:hypothetical protein AB0465_11470 [Streptomyces griseoviridis]|uniref:hypothetical protein n=1 Tax=Streptomyces griseoviridis TaxID=45398 RepID=UPI00344BBC94